ncbi:MULTISPECIES: hypothetical protein [Cyanophyceae]|uniref:Uncharacterized protein n=1 Tax=Leptolyngbya subtilissima DQ-A4 TaxID=2933933 RepID=A0ABV0K9S0_9CYAN|nr:hypothetical protein [Nodosilinea sp. FACHB-141]
MALTIPETIPSTASQGEQRLFNILKTKLPEDFIVWYEPRLQRNLYPDFTILSPPADHRGQGVVCRQHH